MLEGKMEDGNFGKKKKKDSEKAADNEDRFSLFTLQVEYEH